MDDLRIFPGNVSDKSLRLRLQGWHSPHAPIVITPSVSGAERVVASRALEGQADAWIVDVDGLAPDTAYRVGFEQGVAGGEAVVRTPPTTLAGDGLTLALLSCYFPSEEFVSNGENALGVLRFLGVPHLKVFCGDQIYADVPWSPLGEPRPLFDDRYRNAWRDGRLGDLFRYGANAFACDDHEFWNGYPDWMPYLARTLPDAWPDWARQGMSAFWAWSGVTNFAPGVAGGQALRPPRAWCSWRLAGVDIFIADTRSDRMSWNGARCPANLDGGGSCPSRRPRLVMGAVQRRALVNWIGAVQRVGVLVLGQPLAAEASGRFKFDTTLPDFQEYADIVATLREAIDRRPVSFIVLTGDIHWGRLTTWQSIRSPRPGAKLVEFVSSPIARVARKSILSSKFSVASKEDTKWPVGELAPLLAEYDRRAVFATNENNVGVVRLYEDAAGALKARFELWNLDTSDLALNQWDPAIPCRETIDV